MFSKRTVRIGIESRSGSAVTAHSVEGTLFQKSDHTYLLYREPDPSLGETMTTVKYQPGQIKVIRHGSVESDQTFEAGRRLPGRYQNRQGCLFMESETISMAVNLKDGQGSIVWSYGLFIDGVFAGEYHLKLEIAEDEGQ